MSVNLTTERLGPVVSGDPGDPIDYLYRVCLGSVLGVGDTSAGEYDSLARGAVSTRDRRRLAAARLVSSSGDPADVLLYDIQQSDTCPAELVSATPDEFVAWYVRTALSGLAYRADGRSGDAWHDYDDDPRYLDHLADAYGEPIEPDAEPIAAAPASRAGTVRPTWFVEWCARLVHAPKRELLERLGAAQWDGAPAPVIPDTDWGRDVERKFTRRAR